MLVITGHYPMSSHSRSSPYLGMTMWFVLDITQTWSSLVCDVEIKLGTLHIMDLANRIVTEQKDEGTKNNVDT